MGYQITKAFYSKANDKQKAIEEILKVEDPYLFLEKSGYSGF